MEFNIQDEDELKKVAKKIVELVADELESKAVILALQGEMGAGKTTLTKQIAAQFGIAESEITSPTFNLHVPHKGDSATIDHIDFWRIETWDEVEKLGIRNMLKKQHLIIIEWADMFGKEIKTLSNRSEIFWIKIENGNTEQEGERKISIEQV